MPTKKILFLPSEVLGQIIHEVRLDVPTLGRLIQVSLACLELASPLLYNTVTVSREDQYKSLFFSEVVPLSDEISPYLSLRQIKHLSLLLPPPPSLFLVPRSRSRVLSASEPQPVVTEASSAGLRRFPCRRAIPGGIVLSTLVLSSDPEACFSSLLMYLTLSPERVTISHRASTTDRVSPTDGPREVRPYATAASGPKAEQMVKIFRTWSVGKRLKLVEVEGMKLAEGGGPVLLDHWTSLLRETYILNTDPSLVFTFRFPQPIPVKPSAIERFALKVFGHLAKQVGGEAGGQQAGRGRLRLEFQPSPEQIDEDELNRRVNKVRACFTGGFGEQVWVGVAAT